MSDEALLHQRPVKASLDYPCGEPPEQGAAREIAPGVFWLRMSLPLALNHINLWAVRDGEGWSVFDTGMKTAETTAAWQGLFAQGGDLASGSVTRVFVTHMHPDHVGMAGWLTRTFECRLWMTRLEYLSCRALMTDNGRAMPDDGVEFYRRAGWPEDALASYRSRLWQYGKYIDVLPDSYRRLSDGDRLRLGGREWRVITGNGHSPEHACFYCDELQLLISGDQVLPRISSNVSVFPTEPDADPLGDWLESIAKLRREIPDEVLVLPAHNAPFRGLHARLDDLARGHEEGLARLRKALRQPKRAVDVFEQLFARPIGSDSGLMGMATGESVAHLNYLLHRDEIVREADSAGVEWYRMR